MGLASNCAEGWVKAESEQVSTELDLQYSVEKKGTRQETWRRQKRRGLHVQNCAVWGQSSLCCLQVLSGAWVEARGTGGRRWPRGLCGRPVGGRGRGGGGYLGDPVSFYLGGDPRAHRAGDGMREMRKFWDRTKVTSAVFRHQHFEQTKWRNYAVIKTHLKPHPGPEEGKKHEEIKGGKELHRNLVETRGNSVRE